MLDLAFVRNNLADVEDMLRRRGMDPAQTLGGFRAVDERRRPQITPVVPEQVEGDVASPARREISLWLCRSEALISDQQRF